MYCPKCKALLEESPDGTLQCSTGLLSFSIALTRKLREIYGDSKVGEPRAPDLTGSDLHCASCARKVSAPAYLCEPCGISLKPVLFALIELHPHGNGHGKYF